MAKTPAVRLCMASYRGVAKLHRVLNAILNGVWLGVLDREHLHGLSEAAYGKRRSIFQTAEFNRRGLFDWEEKALADYFQGRHRILLAAAGGGREVLALRRRGYEVEAFEAHPELGRLANELLEQEGLEGGVQPAPWDGMPDYDELYDGVIVGWGAYMHIRGRSRRVTLLRRLRQRVVAGSPILISFTTVPSFPITMRASVRMANLLARPLGREPVEVGDWLEPAFTHYFTRETIGEEMRQAGFDLVYYGTDESGRAVGIAKDGPSA